jgi:hypothetical protein
MWKGFIGKIHEIDREREGSNQKNSNGDIGNSDKWGYEDDENGQKDEDDGNVRILEYNE